MSDEAVKAAASRARRILLRLGIQHAVGTSWNDAGTPVVVVDIPPGVDREPVLKRLSKLGADVVVRHVSRSIVAH
jgi:hypothetical protein